MTFATITVASHHFVLTRIHPRMRAVTKELALMLRHQAKSFVNKRGQRIKSGKDKYYYAITDNRAEVRYHINHLEVFKKLLYRHRLDGDGMIEWKTLPSYEAAKIDLTIKPHFIPTDLQEEAIEYILDYERAHSKAIIIQAGGGKTLTAMIAASKQGELMAIFVEPKFIGQWLTAFEQNCLIDTKRICVIGSEDGEKKGYKTSDKLKSLMMMAENGRLPYDAIIISSTTFRNYIQAYEDYSTGEELERKEGYPFPPQVFFERLGIGLRIIDEAHENFHFVFRLDLYTHVRNSTALSATLFSGEEFINQQMETAYPKRLRFDKGGFNKYVTSYSLHYSLRDPSSIRCQGNMGYNHIEFEKSFLKAKEKLKAYFNMTRESMRYTYELNYQPGDRCLIYFASIDMCTLFVDYIQKQFPHLVVKRFVEDDPLENLMTADISVSTVRSAGTGKDIPQLTTVIMTPAINSSPTNIQGFGRLRDLNRTKALGRKMYFVYFVGDDFPKHLDYHANKKELLRTRALTYEKRFYGTLI